MNLQAFSVFDSKAEAYVQPLFSPTIATGIREFTSAANDESHAFNRFAADYTLFHIGEFDQVSGELIPLKVHTNLGNALSFISPASVPVESSLSAVETTPS